MQFAAIQKHQARQRIFHGPVLSFYRAGNWTSDLWVICNSFTHCAIETLDLNNVMLYKALLENVGHQQTNQNQDTEIRQTNYYYNNT